MAQPIHTNSGEKWWRESRYIYFVLSTIWVLSLMFQLIATWEAPRKQVFQSDVGQPIFEPTWIVQPVWERIVATILATAFIIIYVRMMYLVYYGTTSLPRQFTDLGRWQIRIPLLAIAIALALLPHESDFRRWAFSFVFVVIAWTLTSSPGTAFTSVILSTVVSVGLVTLLYDIGAGVGIGFPALALGFMVSGYVINGGIIDQLTLERGRVRDQAVTEERFRLARDLHDTVGHSMTQITLKAELARRILPGDPARAATELEDIEQLSRSLSAEVRRSIAGEVDLSLPVEIGRAKELLPSMGIEVSVKGDIDGWPQEIAEAFAWCLREGVMNTIKHSGATSCEILFAKDSENHRLEIRDNGANQIEENRSGQGIQGMTHRVQTLHGDVQLEQIEPGHMLSIRIPA